MDLRLRDGHDTALTVCEGCGVELAANSARVMVELLS